MSTRRASDHLLRTLARVALLGVAILAPRQMHAAAAPSPVQPDVAADLAWQNLLRGLPPEPAAEKRAAKPEATTPDTVVRIDEKPAATSKADLQASNKTSSSAAKNFYTQYPNHPQAKEARFIEAVAAVRGAAGDTAAGRTQAFAIAQTYRADASQPAEARLKVALMLESRQRPKPTGKPGSDAELREREKTADNLRKEFGELAPLASTYADLMTEATPAESARLAAKVLSLPASEEVKRRAREAIARHKRLGEKVPVKLKDTQGRVVDLGEASGRTTIVYFSGPNDTFIQADRGGKTSTRWVHVVLGKPSETGKTAAPSGFQDAVIRCVQTSGLTSEVCRVLHVWEYPFVVVLDAQGKLQSYGPGHKLAELQSAKAK